LTDTSVASRPDIRTEHLPASIGSTVRVGPGPDIRNAFRPAVENGVTQPISTRKAGVPFAAATLAASEERVHYLIQGASLVASW
jgi:hypothetical protein